MELVNVLNATEQELVTTTNVFAALVIKNALNVAELEKQKMSNFNDGVVYAAARLIEMHDQPTMALEIIEQAGITHDELRKCNEYDLAFLRKEAETIQKGID